MNAKRIFAATLVCVGFCARPACSQVVQLPVFQYFTVNTTVLAPDSGGAYLGGVRRSSWGSASRGVPGLGSLPGFGGRGVGGGSQVAGSHVRATIIDHRAWDLALREAARQQRGMAADVMDDATANRLSRYVDRDASRSAGGGGLMSVAELTRQADQSALDADRELQQLIEQARQCEEDGKLGAARICYRQALRRAPAALQPEIAAKLQRLAPRKTQSGSNSAPGPQDTRQTQ